MATSTLGNGTLVLAGTTSGTTTVTATAVAGTTTLTLPAATDTLVGKATTDTLTNKTLTGAVMNGTLGATTPSTGAFTTLSATGVTTVQAGTAALPAITTTGDTNTGIFFPAADTIAFSEGGVEAARFDSAGNLGLGVTPSAWDSTFKAFESGAGSLNGGSFFVQNNGDYTASIATNLYYNAGWKYKNSASAARYEVYQNNHIWYNAPSGTAGNAISFTQAMTLDASGNLLLGGTSTTQLDGVFGQVIGSSSKATAGITLETSAGAYLMYTDSNDALIFYDAAGNVERARINSSGYFKASNTGSYISSTGTYHELVNDSQTSPAAFIRNSNASFSSTVLAITSGNTTTNNTFYFLDCNNGTPTTKLRIADSGNVTNANNSYGAISDIKLKENIVDATPKLEKLNQVRVVNYNFIGDQQKQLGVIAQEIEQIFPGMVDESPDKDADGNDLGTTTKSVKYSVFVLMLIKALQEQQALITQLTARITALESA